MVFFRFLHCVGGWRFGQLIEIQSWRGLLKWLQVSPWPDLAEEGLHAGGQHWDALAPSPLITPVQHTEGREIGYHHHQEAVKQVETSLFLLDCVDLAWACTSVRNRGSLLGRDVILCNSICLLFFFLNEKIVSCFPVHFQDHLQHHRLWGEDCPSVFFIFRIYRNFFHLESSLNSS